MLSRTKRALQKRCTELALEAQRLAGSGHAGEAAAQYSAATDIARRLAEADPADPRPLQVYAGMLFSLAGLRSRAGQEPGALSALRDCADAYRDLAGRRFADVRQQLAEVEARKAVAQFGLKLGASAVLDADTAVTLYGELLAEKGGDEIALALASALLDSAEALALYGDPDLAAASADYAMRLCLPRQQAPGFSAARLVLAGAMASANHACAGRLDRALAADEARITGARTQLAGDGSAGSRQALATALTLKGLHLQATADPGSPQEAAACLAEAEALDAAEVRKAAQFWERQQAENEDMTLAQALATAAQVLGPERVPADLAAVLTKPVTDGSPLVPSGRCDPRLATRYASRLADVAIALLPAASREGLRIGLEAHYLFASGARFPAPEPGQLITGLVWRARLLLDLCRLLAADTKDPSWSFGLALNLVHYHLPVVEQLMPLVRGGSRPAFGTPSPVAGRSLGELLRDCLAQDAELITRNNDHQVAQNVRKLAASIKA